MEILLRSEFFFTSPDFHSKLRSNLQKCTGCIVSQCTKDSLDPCIEFCMSPCVEFRVKYESSRKSLLNNLKDEMLLTCLHKPDRERCAEQVRDNYRSRLSTLFTSI
jgi:hypothetical protein